MDGTHVLASETAGDLLRTWRRRRRMSQLDLACEADLSPTFLRYLEAGRATADATTLLQIAKCLGLPPRTRTAMLAAAGHPPSFPQHDLAAPDVVDPRAGLEAALAAHDPNPALAIDRYWRVLAANKAVATLVAGVEPLILRQPVNLLRLFLHPAGLSSRIINLPEWRAHLIARLQRDVERVRDGELAELLAEVRDYPCADWGPPTADRYDGGATLRVVTIDGTLSFAAATTMFGTAADASLSIESFVAADAETTALLQCGPALGRPDRAGPPSRVRLGRISGARSLQAKSPGV